MKTMMIESRKDVGQFDANRYEEIRRVLRSVPLRGTPEWDHRERARQYLGCSLLSFGPISG